MSVIIKEPDSYSDSDREFTPSEIIEIAEDIPVNTLPNKSKEKYMNAYNKFMKWRDEKKIKSLSENIILSYLTEMSHTHKPSSLWAIYSMLKGTLHANNNLNIKNYPNLVPFLKKQSQGYNGKKFSSKTLTAEQIKKFLNEAPDDRYLDVKAALIVGICGACRREEFTRITINDVQDKQNLLFVNIPATQNYKAKSFIITHEFYTIVKKYMDLRPKNILTARLFINYQNGRCTQQPIGINKFGNMPYKIASYLGLPEPQYYTGHTFRRTSATLWGKSGVNFISLNQHGDFKSTTVTKRTISLSPNAGENKISGIAQHEDDSESSSSESIDISPRTLTTFHASLPVTSTHISVQTSTSPRTYSKKQMTDPLQITDYDLNTAQQTPVAKKQKTNPLQAALITALKEPTAQPDPLDGFLARLGEGMRRLPYRVRARLEIEFLTLLAEKEDLCANNIIDIKTEPAVHY